jgi:hypothetical protein
MMPCKSQKTITITFPADGVAVLLIGMIQDVSIVKNVRIQTESGEQFYASCYLPVSGIV